MKQNVQRAIRLIKQLQSPRGWINVCVVFILLTLASCLGQPHYFYSPSTHQRHGIVGYVKVNNKKVFPVTHICDGYLIKADAVYMGQGEFLEKDTFNAALWPKK